MNLFIILFIAVIAIGLIKRIIRSYAMRFIMFAVIGFIGFGSLGGSRMFFTVLHTANFLHILHLLH